MRRRLAVIAGLAAVAGGCRSADSPAVEAAAEAGFAAPSLTPDELARLEEQAADELVRWTRERDERLLEAIDPGEKAEHARRIRQPVIDRGGATIAEIFRQGEALFERDFTLREGLGTGLLDRPRPALSRVENRAELGGPDALSCRECHGRGGDDGHGELHQRAWLDGDGRHFGSAKPRLPPHVAGLGLVQRLGEEMSAELQAELATGREIARQTGPARVRLESKGVAFGEITVHPDGHVDGDGRRGVDADLVIRPFGWKGVRATLRDFAGRALAQHVGLESPPLTEPGAAARPSFVDRDHDGVDDELHDGQLTSLVAYLALLDVPQVRPPHTPALARAWEQGLAAFREVGCDGCHRPELPLVSPRLVEAVPGHAGGLQLDLITDCQVAPRLEQFDYTRPAMVRLFSDLKRHDLGPQLAERAEGGAGRSEFLTRPLWGIGDRGPYYLHDGRARSLRAAILAHGGEAQAVSDRFAQLPIERARAIELFLLSLRRAPQGRFAP